MEVLHPRCAGLDLGAELVVACRRLVTEAGVQAEVQSFGGTVRELMRLRAWLEDAGVTHVVMEATGVYWKPVWHALEDGPELILANPMHVKQVPGRKSDVNDAQWLADLLAHGLVQASFVPDRATQELRDLTRTHKQLTREAARHVQRIQKVLEDADIKLTGVLADVLGGSGRRILKSLVEGERSPEKLADLALRKARKKIPELIEALGGHIRSHHRFLIGLHLGQLEAVEAAIKDLESRMEEHLKPHAEQVRLLCTIPGIGLTGARAILAEIGSDMSRFPTVGHLISWAGFCPQMHESAGKRKTTRIRKGAPWLKEMLVQCAWSAVRVKDSYLKARFHRLKARRGPKKAIVAIGADMLRATYFILKRGTEYQDLGGDYYDRLDTNKARSNLVRRLKALGYEVELTPVA
ncbi:MAG TPA: IS110 family transposase [Holophaga sp.]|nr:IS110 family transposase [Holophaga sp.]